MAYHWGVLRDLLLNKLRSGTTLVVDRYAYSGAAFTAAKEIPGLTLEWCKVSLPVHASSLCVIQHDIPCWSRLGAVRFHDIFSPDYSPLQPKLWWKDLGRILMYIWKSTELWV
jgi:hypothetical protein